MADKKVILIICGEADVTVDSPSVTKFINKACTFTAFNNAETLAEATKIEGAATVAAEEISKAFEGEGALALVELGNVAGDALENALTQVSDAADRRTLIVLATDGGLFISGFGINKKAGAIDRKVQAADIIATICYVADLPIPEDCTGGILYQALKDPNMKLKEIKKLQDAIGRMEIALQRDKREPWDKHDCA
jgi:hypothetical protein